MASVAGWTDAEITRPVLRGLRFPLDSDESDYRRWRTEHIRPFTRFAMYSATSAAVLAWFAVLFGALEVSRTAALWLIPVEIAFLAASAVIVSSPKPNRWLIPLSSAVNAFGGVLAITLTYSLHDPLATAACISIAALFGLTMFRMPPNVAFASVAPYTIAAEVVVALWYADGEIERFQFVVSTFVVLTVLVTGMVLNLAMEWITRQTYADHVVIEGQREALFEERTNMAKFLSPQVAQAIHDRGLAATLGTRLLELTAVSVDLRGFTRYTQAQGPARMAEVLRDYYEAVIDGARDMGATVKDFAGDGAMILVGAPLKRTDHARAGLVLARRLQVTVGEVTARYSTPDTPLGVGIGVASGQCAVGAIGSLSQLEYTAVGTAVNLSSRLCDEAEDGQILLAAATAEAAGPEPHWRSGRLAVAGFDDPVEVMVEETVRSSERLVHDD